MGAPRVADGFSTDAGERTVVPPKRRVPPAVVAKVLRSMTGVCLECRQGTRSTMVASVSTKCKTCDGHGSIESYPVNVAAYAAGVPISKTFDALQDMREMGLVSMRMHDSAERYSLTERGLDARKRCK